MVEIHFDHKLMRWNGSFEFPLPPQSIEFLQLRELCQKGVKVSLAGVMSQMKYIASQRFADPIHFYARQELAAALCFFKDSQRTEEHPGSLCLVFQPSDGSAPVRFEVCGIAFSASDYRQYNQFLACSGLSEEAIVREVMNMVDDPSVWRLIEIVADSIIAQPAVGDEQRRILNEPLLDALLSG